MPRPVTAVVLDQTFADARRHLFSTAMATESDSFSPYRPDGKLYGFVCVVTGADRPLGKAVVLELACKPIP